MFALQPAAVSDHKTLVRTLRNNANDRQWWCQTTYNLCSIIPSTSSETYWIITTSDTERHCCTWRPPPHSPSGSFRGRSARFPSVPLALSPFLPSLPAGLWAEDVSGSVREQGWRWSGYVPSLFFPLVTLCVSADCSLLPPCYSLRLCWLLYLATLSRPSGQGSLLVAERWTVEQQV